MRIDCEKRNNMLLPFHCKANSHCSSRTLVLGEPSPSNPQEKTDTICCKISSDQLLFVEVGRYAGNGAADATRLFFITL